MSSPFDIKKPLFARILSKPGPPDISLLVKDDAKVLALPGRYCVSYVIIGDQETAVVDVGSIADAPSIKKAIDILGLKSPKYIIPTHLHFDHIMGIDYLAKSIGAKVTLGRLAYKAIREGYKTSFPPYHLLWRAVGTYFLQGLPLPPKEDFLYGLDFGFPWARNRFESEVVCVPENGELGGFGLKGWRVLETPGHANEAISLYNEAGILIAGDCIRNFYGGEWNTLVCDKDKYEETKRLLLSLHVEYLLPGHGPIIKGRNVIKNIRKSIFFLP